MKQNRKDLIQFMSMVWCGGGVCTSMCLSAWLCVQRKANSLSWIAPMQDHFLIR